MRHCKLHSARNPPSAPLSDEDLKETVRSYAGSTADSFRLKLAEIRRTGNGKQLLNNMPPTLWASIIHTSYFDDARTTEAIAKHIVDRASPSQERATVSFGDIALKKKAEQPRRAYQPRRYKTATLTALAFILILLVPAFDRAFISGLFAYTRDFQISQIASRSTDPSVLAFERPETLSATFLDLMSLGKFDLSAKSLNNLLDRISNPYSAANVAQRLAFHLGYAGRWGASMCSRTTSATWSVKARDGLSCDRPSCFRLPPARSSHIAL